MPELPEVETMCRGITACRGCTITAVERPRCRLKPIQMQPQAAALRRQLVGAQIVEIQRVGKRPVLRLNNEKVLVFEPRMTGLLLLTDPPDKQHLRLCLHLRERDQRRKGPQRLLFWDRRGLGTVQLLTNKQFAVKLGPKKLGPDALAITAAEFQEQLGGSRREIKVALLDQRAVAGIGNLYAAEILHTARIHPQTTCRRLRTGDWNRLALATKAVLSQAIRYEGSTLSDGTYRNALNRPGRYQNHHRVYDREGQPCEVCLQGSVRRMVQCQRATFYCPRCQRKRG